MANGNTKIQDTTLHVGNHQIIISSEGIWVDVLRQDGTVASSVGLAWEEFLSLYDDSAYEVVQRDSDLPLCKAV